MNNRLHKLTDSLESQLNYRSRCPGPQTRKRNPKGTSPLFQSSSSPPLLITSRTKAPSPKLSPRKNCSVAYSSCSSKNDHQQILIIDNIDPDEILILDSQSETERQKGSEVQQWGQQLWSPVQEFGEEKSEGEEGGQVCNDKGPSVLIESDQKLIWIQKEEGQKAQEKYNSESIKIQDDSYESSEELSLIDGLERPEEYEGGGIEELQIERHVELPEITELSSIEEQDIQQSFLVHSLTASNVPVSPQTTNIPPPHSESLIRDAVVIPLSQPSSEQQVNSQGHIVSNTSKYHQCSKALESILIDEEQSGGESEVFQQGEELPLSSKYTTSYSENKLIDQQLITEKLDDRERPFRNSVQQTERLREETGPRKIQAIQQMLRLIKQESGLLGPKVREQFATLHILRIALHHKISIPSQLLPQGFRMSQDHIIAANQLLIFQLAAIKIKM